MASEQAAAKAEAIWRPDPHLAGMVVFISSEAVFFASLILSFVYLRAQGALLPRTVEALDIGRTAIFTLFLFASSGTAQLATWRLGKRDQRGLALWLFVTVALGGTFLGGQLSEYAALLQENAFRDNRLFGSGFFALTGFHGLHVLVGLVILLILAAATLAGDFRRRKGVAVEAAALYWHFVDAVWVFVFAVVYLWTRLS